MLPVLPNAVPGAEAADEAATAVGRAEPRDAVPAACNMPARACCRSFKKLDMRAPTSSASTGTVKAVAGIGAAEETAAAAAEEEEEEEVAAALPGVGDTAAGGTVKLVLSLRTGVSGDKLAAALALDIFLAAVVAASAIARAPIARFLTLAYCSSNDAVAVALLLL